MTPMEQSERKGLVERIPELRKIAEAAKRLVDGAWWNRDALHDDCGMETVDAHYVATFDPPTVLALLDFLSSDARPAPMAEDKEQRIVVDIGAAAAALEASPELAAMMNELVGGPALVEAQAEIERLQTALADLTRKVAEAEAAHEITAAQLHSHALANSRPQQTDAVLAERESCAAIAMDEAKTGREDGPPSHAAYKIAAAIRSRPFPGPATETDRKDGGDWRLAHDFPGGLGLYINGMRVGVVSVMAPSQWWARTAADVIGQFPSREEAQRALLASVRPKAEGV